MRFNYFVNVFQFFHPFENIITATRRVSFLLCFYLFFVILLKTHMKVGKKKSLHFQLGDQLPLMYKLKRLTLMNMNIKWLYQWIIFSHQ